MNESRLIDVSVRLNRDTPVWPDDSPIGVRIGKRIAAGAGANVTRLDIGTHTGSHIDAPWHFLDNGPKTDSISLDRLNGDCFVADLTSATEHITPADFEEAGIPENTRRLILKTTNSDLWESSPEIFRKEFIGITVEGAKWLVDHGVDLLGIDYLSVEPFYANGDTHRTMLRAKMVILETIDLRQVKPGNYQLYCLPLKVDNLDGAPCRVALEPRS